MTKIYSQSARANSTSLFAGEAPVIFGDGSAPLDFIYVEDVARANLLALQREDITNDFFNAASGKETTPKELLDVIVKLTGTNIAPVYQPRDKKLLSGSLAVRKKPKKSWVLKRRHPLKKG